MDSLLLCTFAHNSDIKLITDYIYQNYELERGSIFVFENEDDPDEMFCTYNVVSVDHFIENTIMIHRKKESNTLYTINALNEIIKLANGGYLDKNFIVDWTLYINSMLLSTDQSVRVVPLVLKHILRK
jgi:hypothetical protein